MIFKKIFFSISPILTFTIQEESMMPLFYPGDVVLVSRLPYRFINPKVGDIVILRSPIDNKYLLKFVDRIEKSKYFVLGKNKEKSVDSRKFGWITKREIVGKVLLKV